MNIRIFCALLAPVIALITADMALAQSKPEVSVEVSSDHRRRGLSWSDGDPTAAAEIYWSATPSLWVEAGVTGLRGSARHGGADAVIDLNGGWRRDIGLFHVGAQGGLHIFPGEGDLTYGEFGGSAGASLGPVQVDGYALYAPPQDAIGGDNLYLGIDGSVGIPSTPFTLTGGVGRSSGSVDDPIRAARLRPGGSYTDYRVGIDYRKAWWSVGLTYSDTDIGEKVASPYADPGNAGSRLAGRVRVSF